MITADEVLMPWPISEWVSTTVTMPSRSILMKALGLKNAIVCALASPNISNPIISPPPAAAPALRKPRRLSLPAVVVRDIIVSPSAI